MGLNSEDWQKINGCLVRLYRELDAEKQPRLMLQALKELVPSEAAALNIAHLAGANAGKLSLLSLPENYANPEQAGVIGRYAHQAPFSPYFLATQDYSWRMPSDFMPDEDYHKLELYQLGQKPLGANYNMIGMLAVMESTVHALSLHRAHERFTEHDREILNIIQPHLVNSYINAIVHSRAKNSVAQLQAAVEAAPGAYGYFDAQGKVAWLQEKAAAWLNEFYPNEVKHDGKIPHSVRQSLTTSQQENNAPQKLEQPGGEKEILTVCLGASPVGGWVMRLERRPKEFLPRFRPMPQFTERQNEVLRWMVEGKRNGEIASILHISERTVEKHVTEILAGLQVENRATAIVRALEFGVRVNMGG